MIGVYQQLAEAIEAIESPAVIDPKAESAIKEKDLLVALRETEEGYGLNLTYFRHVLTLAAPSALVLNSLLGLLEKIPGEQGEILQQLHHSINIGTTMNNWVLGTTSLGVIIAIVLKYRAAKQIEELLPEGAVTI